MSEIPRTVQMNRGDTSHAAAGMVTPSSENTSENTLALPSEEELVNIDNLKDLETTKQRLFVYLIVYRDELAERAAELAGYASRDGFRRTARDLLKNPKIQVALNKLSEGRVPRYKLLKYWEEILENPVVPVYDKNKTYVEDRIDQTLRLKALTEISKIRGMYAQEAQDTFKPIITEEELAKRIENAAKVLAGRPIDQP